MEQVILREARLTSMSIARAPGRIGIATAGRIIALKGLVDGGNRNAILGAGRHWTSHGMYRYAGVAASQTGRSCREKSDEDHGRLQRYECLAVDGYGTMRAMEIQHNPSTEAADSI